MSVFLSDVTASVDWPLARQVLDYLDIPVPEDEDLDQVLPVGDMSIFADLGMDEMDLGALSGDLDLFPDEVLASLARRIGFGPALERALDFAMGAMLTGWSGPMTGYGRRFEPAMRAALAEASCGWPDRDVPVGAVVLDESGAVIGARPQSARGPAPIRPRTPRSWPFARPGRRAATGASMTARSWSPSSRARCARARAGRPDRRGWCTEPAIRGPGAAGSVWDVLHDPRLGPPVEVSAASWRRSARRCS